MIYITADTYAIGLFIDLQSGSVCMHSGSYFLNPREFCVLNIFLPFVSYNIFLQVCFIHNFCNLNDTANQVFFILYITMTNSATMRAIFERRGFTPGAAASLEGNYHGINTLEEVVFINDKDIDSLVKQLRRPGGGD
jgi:hypothetical protein